MSNGGNGGPEPKALPIPADWDDVTPAWMTVALASRHPGTEVGEVRLVLRDDGNNRRARFGVTYSAGTGPATVFCKAEGLGEHRVLHRNNGDAHIGNTYVLPDGEVGFLDWQVARRGGWSQDVGYFLVGSLTVTDRREHEADLVAEYLGALEVPGERRPSPEAGWLSYRASAAYGLAVWLSTLGTDGWQRRDVSLALAERYGAAFVELETEAALDRLNP